MFNLFRVPIILTVIALALTLVFGGVTAAITVAILGLLEISFSFDNAIVNAKILGKMNAYWQRIFLTVGVLIAVFGMRLIFPLIIVSLAAHISPLGALSLALTNPGAYAAHISAAHPAIAAFGGMFLLMLFLDWLIEEKEVFWLQWESYLYKMGKIENISVIIALVLLTLIAPSVVIPGMLGIVTYLAVNSIEIFFNEDSVAKVAKAGLATFLYLEVLDASFSFDGVVGAFAITNNILFIALGLGIGAMFIRGLTVYLTNKGTLSEYRYLEHGAHWAIGVLSILLLLTVRYDLSDIMIGGTGIILIAMSLYDSIAANRGLKRL